MCDLKIRSLLCGFLLAMSFSMVAFGQNSIRSVDEKNWEHYESNGWRRIWKDDYSKAKDYFSKAWEVTGDNKERQACTLSGLAWAHFWTARKQVETFPRASSEAKSVELYGKVVQYANRSLALWGWPKEGPFNPLEQRYIAYALEIRGYAQVMLCQGKAAASSLASATKYYDGLKEDNRYFASLHYLGKLYQCRRQFAKAYPLFLSIVEQRTPTRPSVPTNPERRARALLDYVNNLIWLGQIKVAWMQYPKWLSIVYDQVDDNSVFPKALAFRGTVLFARAALIHGEFEKSAELLCKAEELDTECDRVSYLCRNVLWIVSAELALARGELELADKHLNKVNVFLAQYDPGERFQSGYDCLEIIAIDASCQHCVIESCTREIICANACLSCKPCRVVFTEKSVERVPVDVVQLIQLLANHVRARATLHKGDFKAANDQLKSIIAKLQKIGFKNSLVLIVPLVARAEANSLLGEIFTTVKTFLDQAIDVANLYTMADGKVYQSILVSEKNRWLGYHHRKLSRYDLAADSYQQAWKHGMQARRGMHPTQLFLQVRHLEALFYLRDSIEANGPKYDPDEFDKARDNLTKVVHCFDHRLYVTRTIACWICLLKGNTHNACRCFESMDRSWNRRAENYGVLDPRQSSARLGVFAAKSELGKEVSDNMFKEFRRLSVRQYSPSTVAHDLNRTGLLLRNVGLFDAAKVCFKRAIELYKDYPKYAETVQNTLDKLPKER